MCPTDRADTRDINENTRESGSMFDLRAEGNSLTPPRDRVSKSLLDASATMATTDLVGPAIGFVAFASGILCVVGWKRGWCYTEGESGAMRPGAYVL